jgi:hypothetical protein
MCNKYDSNTLNMGMRGLHLCAMWEQHSAPNAKADPQPASDSTHKPKDQTSFQPLNPQPE